MHFGDKHRPTHADHALLAGVTAIMERVISQGNQRCNVQPTSKKSSDKMLPPVGIEPRPLITSDSS